MIDCLNARKANVVLFVFWAALILGAPRIVQGQLLGIPEPVPVDHRGAITGLDPVRRLMSIETGSGIEIADFNAIRRLRNGAILTGIPEPRVTIYEIYPRSMLEESMTVMFLAKVVDLKETEGTVSDFTLIPTLPENGFAQSESDLVSPRPFRTEEENGEADSDSDKVTEPDAIEYMIFGEVTQVRDDSITVAVPTPTGRRRVRVSVDENAFLRRQSGNLRVLAIGDELRVVGQSIEPPSFYATEIVAVHYGRRAPRIEYELGIKPPSFEDIEEAEITEVVDRGDLPRGSDPFDRARMGAESPADEATDPESTPTPEASSKIAKRPEEKEANGNANAKLYLGELLRINSP